MPSVEDERSQDTLDSLQPSRTGYYLEETAASLEDFTWLPRLFDDLSKHLRANLMENIRMMESARKELATVPQANNVASYRNEELL